jgi:hypothetical protein
VRSPRKNRETQMCQEHFCTEEEVRGAEEKEREK